MLLAYAIVRDEKRRAVLLRFVRARDVESFKMKMKIVFVVEQILASLPSVLPGVNYPRDLERFFGLLAVLAEGGGGLRQPGDGERLFLIERLLEAPERRRTAGGVVHLLPGDPPLTVRARGWPLTRGTARAARAAEAADAHDGVRARGGAS